jgi:hypothetical protein
MANYSTIHVPWLAEADSRCGCRTVREPEAGGEKTPQGYLAAYERTGVSPA